MPLFILFNVVVGRFSQRKSPAICQVNAPDQNTNLERSRHPNDLSGICSTAKNVRSKNYEKRISTSTHKTTPFNSLRT